MLDFMERSTIKLLKQRGTSQAEIARTLGRDAKTVHRALEEPSDRKYQGQRPGSLVDPYVEKMEEWIEEGVPVTVMLRRAREDEATPYKGGRSIFYEKVKLIRRKQKQSKQEATWRFEGLAGEYLQVDWGETRHFPFTRIAQETRYCFVCRLKYSRWVYAEFQGNMRFETLIRCIVRSFEALGGLPWVLVFDNMATVTSGRNEDGTPIWNPKFLQFASEIGFHPELCAPYSPNQKGTVENGVKFVKGNFLSGRSFVDDEDLCSQLKQWQDQSNNQICQAHGQTPNALLVEERQAFEPLTETSDGYGLLHSQRVNPESTVRFQTNNYSVPESCIGQIVTVRVAQKELRIYHDDTLVAQHQRSFGKRQWIRDLNHYEKTLAHKPRAKVMAYREKLLGVDASTAAYVAAICRRDRQNMNQQILNLYALWQQYGTERFSQAVCFCQKEQVYGDQYVELMLRGPQEEVPEISICLSEQPIQSQIDRDLAIYDSYTHR